MNGIDQAKQVRDKIASTIVQTKETVATNLPAVGEGDMEHTLAVLSQNKQLAQMYQESARLGSENLNGSVASLKVHTTNKSTGNVLADGTEPNDGWFFHNKSARQFKNPICHILTISAGFRAEGMVDQKTGKKGDDKFNQIMGGVIIDGSERLPFIFYFTGVRLQRMWDFAKEAGQFTHAKPFPIPMFALSVKLSTVKEKNAYGMTSVVEFEILRNEDGTPVIVSDPAEFIFLRDSVEPLETTIASLIASKSSEAKVQVIETAKPNISAAQAAEFMDGQDGPAETKDGDMPF
jgi:hypothetical protein